VRHGPCLAPTRCLEFRARMGGSQTARLAPIRFREIFNLVDLDKGGTISKDELKQLMNTLGLKPTQASTAHSHFPAAPPLVL
jgi:hypothetical protein